MQLRRIHRYIKPVILFILLVGAALAIWEKQWLTAVTTIAIMLFTLFSLLLGRRLGVFIPPEFELLAIAFVFASIFLGEVRGYYVRFWWWDIVLHTSSGFLLGIIGFLLVHVLNEKKEIELHMNPGFVALFAFMFAVGIGALWEIFEFAMDSFFGMNMQKAMLKDPSGLTDTMWDLIVDTIGAAIIALLGYGYLKTAGNKSFLEQWIAAFIETNPRFFRRNR